MPLKSDRRNTSAELRPMLRTIRSLIRCVMGVSVGYRLHEIVVHNPFKINSLLVRNRSLVQRLWLVIPPPLDRSKSRPWAKDLHHRPSEMQDADCGRDDVRRLAGSGAAFGAGRNERGRLGAANVVYQDDPGSVATVTGEVVSVDKFTPEKGMSDGVHAMIKTDKETLSVHLGLPGTSRIKSCRSRRETRSRSKARESRSQTSRR